VALSLVTLGAAQYHLGAYAEATASHQQSLAVFSETENRREIAECLEVLAMLAQTDGYSAHAARLFAAAEAAFEEIGSSMRPSKNPRYEGCVAELRAGLGEDRFAAAWGEGRAMRLEDAMAAALETEQVAVGKHGPSDPILRPATPPARASKSPSQNGTHLLAEGLTRREQDVAALLARGLTNQQIAAELTISQRTAETHVCNILSKLGLHRRAQLTAWAVEHALQST
jgi:non-specific serine/threonine protein kinase